MTIITKANDSTFGSKKALWDEINWIFRSGLTIEENPSDLIEKAAAFFGYGNEPSDSITHISEEVHTPPVVMFKQKFTNPAENNMLFYTFLPDIDLEFSPLIKSSESDSWMIRAENYNKARYTSLLMYSPDYDLHGGRQVDDIVQMADVLYRAGFIDGYTAHSATWDGVNGYLLNDTMLRHAVDPLFDENWLDQESQYGVYFQDEATGRHYPAEAVGVWYWAVLTTGYYKHEGEFICMRDAYLQTPDLRRKMVRAAKKTIRAIHLSFD